jgi:hypothetical protein
MNKRGDKICTIRSLNEFSIVHPACAPIDLNAFQPFYINRAAKW